MNKLKICVYAISKNEEKFVKRWMNSVNEADEIFVLDTGSTDNTVEKLKKMGAHVVVKEIIPWRFDVARNEALNLIPEDYDICVSLDLDEIIEKGWRKKLEILWKNGINHLRYNYNWSLDKNNKPIINFYIEKIHSRKDFKWINPVHEVLKYTGKEEKWLTTDEITVNHYPDRKKSRSSYLPLLELSVKEDPLNDRNMHYLGREYMYYNRYNDAIDTLIKHLKLKSATWKDERCASMRFIARCYYFLERYDEANMWYEKAINEAPYLKDPYMEKALFHYMLKDYTKTKEYCLESLRITNNQKSYINEEFSNDFTAYDLLQICEYYLNNFDKSLYFCNKALEIEPNNKRLNNNKKIIKEKKNSIKN